MVNNSKRRPRVKMTGGGTGLVNHAGARLLADLADKVGLTAGLSAAMAPTKQRRRGHDRGEVLAVAVSATQKTGLDKLLEALTLQAELSEPMADPDRRAEGVVLESQLDRGRGPVATVLVKEGTLRRGDAVVMGTVFGRVRTMLDEHGKVVKEILA